jgi:hypothetical protein
MIFTSNTFAGHWPVGTAAVVRAADEEMAVAILCEKLKEIGLPQDEPPTVTPFEGEVVILQDGNY